MALNKLWRLYSGDLNICISVSNGSGVKMLENVRDADKENVVNTDDERYKILGRNVALALKHGYSSVVVTQTGDRKYHFQGQE